MPKLLIIDQDGTLTDESQRRILQHTEVLECACPQHLLKILDSIKSFQEYETGCIIKYPKDAEIHNWLLDASKELEKLATATIVTLMRKESIIDDQNFFCVPPNFPDQSN